MNVIEGAKAVADLARAYDKLDLYRQAIELMGQVTELATENFELKQQIALLKEALEVRGTLAYRQGAYFRTKAGAEDGPYCTNCYDTKKLLVRLAIYDADTSQCPNCKTYREKG